MATSVIMPRQGQSVETCIIAQWHKQVGDKVSVGDILFSYETDKAAFDEESKVSGVLLAIFFQEGDEVPVLEKVAVIGEPGEKVQTQEIKESVSEESSSASATDSSGISNETTKQNNSATVAPTTGQPDNDKTRISPLARKLSQEWDVDISRISGSGPNGRIIKSDIEQARKLSSEKKAIRETTPITSSTPSGAQTVSAPVVLEENRDFTTEKLSNIRKVIAARMQESLQQSAQLTHHLSADARKLLAYRKQFKADLAGGKISADITINDMVCFAVIRALRKHPQMNAHFLGDTIKVFKNVHIGFAVDTPRGLMVPALQNADNYNISGLSDQLKTLASQCKEGTISPDLLSATAAGFTISNLGAFGIEMFTPVLNLPQTGILGVNTITHRPADLGDGTIGIVPHIGLSLTYDHRAIDGAPASAFLREVKLEVEKLDGSW